MNRPKDDHHKEDIRNFLQNNSFTAEADHRHIHGQFTTLDRLLQCPSTTELESKTGWKRFKAQRLWKSIQKSHPRSTANLRNESTVPLNPNRDGKCSEATAGTMTPDSNNMKVVLLFVV